MWDPKRQAHKLSQFNNKNEISAVRNPKKVFHNQQLWRELRTITCFVR